LIEITLPSEVVCVILYFTVLGGAIGLLSNGMYLLPLRAISYLNFMSRQE